jgi:tetratricopeptide (TPR) repeat protein
LSFLSGIIHPHTTPLLHPMTQSPQEQRADLGEGVISLPAVPHSEKTGSQQGRGWNIVLAILALALAFLAASFPARNSDLWFHLATGRLLAQGRFSFGADPFAYTTQQVYWPCHTWLFDLALYGLRGLIGDAGLILLKALVITALAGLLLSIRRPSGAAWLPVFCTMLAILALSPRLLLQPTCFSYFLLGLTSWLLWRQKMQASHRIWPLLLVFVLWVNFDEWFLLGPLLAALFWLGERLQPAQNVNDGSHRTPGWLVPAGMVVCLMNPYTYHAFTLPADLSIVSWTSGLREDARFRALFSSPWDAEHLRAAMRLNSSVLAYYVLTLLGLVSFLLHPPALRDWRLLVWLPFALLAAWQARLAPFFAIVAAPITALNWQDIVCARSTARSTRGRFLLGTSYLALVLSLLSLIALTWLGWLAGYDREERHVAWGFQEDPSLRQAAQALNDWHRQGLLPDDERIFAFAPEVAHYGAWYCPGIRHFFDHRYPLFPQAARDYETVCQELLLSPASPEKQRTADWSRVLRDHKVGIVVFYDRDPQQLFAVLHRLASDTENWTLLHMAGQALIVGWNKARPSGGFDSLALDADRLAFGPRDAKTQREAPPAPERGPEQLPSRRDFWARLAHPPTSPSWESVAATMYLHYFQDSADAQLQQKLQFLMPAYAASLAGLAAQVQAMMQVSYQFVSARKVLFPGDLVSDEQLGPFFAPLAERSPALLLLALRAARRAEVANPQDANVWLRLGQAYLLMRDLTCERSSEGLFPPLAQVRHVQIVTALEQAVRLDPNLEEAHRELAYLYGSSNSLDQALEHRQEEARISRRFGPRPGETADDFAYRMEYLEKDTAKLVDLVQDRRKKYASGSHSFPGDHQAQARLALKLGLPRKAVEEILLPSPADLLGAAGIRMELELLLSMGKVQEVRSILSDKGVRTSKHGLGQTEYHWPAYEWLHVLAAAAIGDYSSCREDLRAIRALMRVEYDQLRQQADAIERSIPSLLTRLLSAGPLPAFNAFALCYALEERRMLEVRQRSLLAQRADRCVLEGLLALEQGDVDAARSTFAEAEKLPAAIPFAGRPIVAYYLGKLKDG